MGSSDLDGCGALVVLILGAIGLVIALLVVYYVVLPLTAALVSAAVLWGGGYSVVNYVKAFRAEVKAERPWLP